MSALSKSWQAFLEFKTHYFQDWLTMFEKSRKIVKKSGKNSKNADSSWLDLSKKVSQKSPAFAQPQKETLPCKLVDCDILPSAFNCYPSNSTPFKYKFWTEIAPFPVKLFHAKNIWRLQSIYLHLPGMTTEKYVAKIRHGYTSVKELEREIFCIKCAKKCYSPAAFALHYDRHLLTNKTSAATSNRCDLTIKELKKAFFLPQKNQPKYVF